MTTTSEVGQRDREELLTGIPVTERRLQVRPRTRSAGPLDGASPKLINGCESGVTRMISGSDRGGDLSVELDQPS
jgi:hypothetical protein